MFLANCPPPHLIFGWVAGALRLAQSNAGGQRWVCAGEKAAKEGWGSFQEEECQEAQTPDGNQMYFLGPERIFRTMEEGWGKLDYKKVFLISLKKKKSL